MKETIDRLFSWAVVALAVSFLMGGSLAAQAVSISEDFSGSLDPGLQDVTSIPGKPAPPRFTISGGKISKTTYVPPVPPETSSCCEDRSYIRTVATDYNTVDFIAELTYTLSATPRTTIHFFGLGSGDPDSSYFNESNGFYFRIHEPPIAGGLVHASARVFGSAGVFLTVPSLGGISTPGTHRARLRKTGTLLAFSIDRDYAGGPFVADLGPVVIDMSLVAHDLNTTNSRIYFGTESPDHTFDDLEITLLCSGTALCRPAVSSCDVPEFCSAGFCPADSFAPATTVCNAGSGDLCDPDEFCSGLSPFCPADTVASAATVCNAGSGDLCDPSEFCTGIADLACPADSVASFGTVCNAGSGDLCDPDEFCTGVADLACPADVVASTSTVCNAGSGDLCDPDELCTGVADVACPADIVVPAATLVCNAGSGDLCDPDELCTGVADVA